MRWIFISLVVANAGFFMWWWLPEPEVESEPVRNASSFAPIGELRMLSEMDKQPIERLALSRDSDEAGEALCTLVGPFSELVVAEHVVENLQALEVSLEVRNIEVPEGSSYWVYLPPEESRKTALRKLRELQAKGIDSYVIPKGDLANGISFGVFSRKVLADRRLEAMNAQGYAAKLHEVKRSHSEVWVMLDAGESEKVSEEFWQKLSERQESLERRENFCLGVASE